MERKFERKNERGSAIVISLFVLALLMAFVAFSISRTTTETIAAGNDTVETRTSKAAEASLEAATQQFDNVFEDRFEPTPADITAIQNITTLPNLIDHTFINNIQPLGTSSQVPAPSGPYSGLTAIRSTWLLTSTATHANSGVQVQLQRAFHSDRIPIFQFGIFYEDDLEFHPGPEFNFGGRVHANGNIFLAGGTGLRFRNKVSANKEIFTDVGKNGRSVGPSTPTYQWADNVYLPNSSGTLQKLGHARGSVLNRVTTGPQKYNSATSGLPNAWENTNWRTDAFVQFNGNLVNQHPLLRLPLRIARQNPDSVSYIDLIKRGRNVGDMHNNLGTVEPVTATNKDDAVFVRSRYANKNGLRISLSDSKERLPGCALSSGGPVTTPCGVRLDGDEFGGIDRNNNNAVVSDEPGIRTGSNLTRGYQPRTMRPGGNLWSYQASRANGDRLVARNSDVSFQTTAPLPGEPALGAVNAFPIPIPNRGVWIKIELSTVDTSTNTPVTKDVTEDILSLGVTEWAEPIGSNSFAINDPIYYSRDTDKRSIVKIQRYLMPGDRVINPLNSNSPFFTDYTWSGKSYNMVVGDACPVYPSPCPIASNTNDQRFMLEGAHQRQITLNGGTSKFIVPFPIMMYDTREGLYNENINPTTEYGNNFVPRAGIMSLIDIDVRNLRSFLRGDYDAFMPNDTYYARTLNGGNPLRAVDVPNEDGWVLYVSDRRGDNDFDGDYDMENVFVSDRNTMDGVTATSTPEPGEDVNFDRDMDVDYGANGEAPKYGEKYPADYAAVTDHRYYRRGVRLINGTRLPGEYLSATPGDTKGFTVATENAVYVKGNYNATHVANASGFSAYTDYRPFNTIDHIPASVVGDAVLALSNAWEDGRSFRYPFDADFRPAIETTMRFAMISGDSISSLENTSIPDQGGSDPRLAGGVHNFKRFLETWQDDRLNYTGSLINLYNARVNNGTFKCCDKVYEPPTRNWVFDTTFLDPNRLPPATPYFQLLQVTGFQRVNN